MALLFARIKKSSKYNYQDPGEPFEVRLTESASQAADGYLWEADVGGTNFRTSDLDLYVLQGGLLIKVREKKE